MDFSEICGDFGLIVAGDRDRSGLLSPSVDLGLLWRFGIEVCCLVVSLLGDAWISWRSAAISG